MIGAECMCCENVLLSKFPSFRKIIGYLTLVFRHEPYSARSGNILVFFQNEDILVQLDELDELDRTTHAWIRI